MKQIFNNYKNSFYYLKYKILFLICVLIIFRIGSFIPILGIDFNILNNFFIKNNNNITEMLNIFSGGGLSRISIFSLGLIPYISASIIIQIINFIYPKLIKNNKEINNNTNKIIKYTTFLFSIFQSIIILINFNKIFQFNNLIINYNKLFYLIFIINLITGSMILMWLGEKITEKGFCNGISIIMCIGILINFPLYINNILLNKEIYNFIFLKIILFLLLLFLIIFFIVFIECSQRKIFLNHQQKKNKFKFYSTQNIYLPIKINISGVIPVIFSSSVVLFITNIISLIIKIFDKYTIIKKIILCLQPGNIIYIILYINFIILFSFFGLNLFFNSKETADNLKKTNTFIYGIRPGNKTKEYINSVVIRLNNLGIIYILFICLIPEIFNKIIGSPYYLCGTSILIVTLVIIEFISQIQTLLIEKQYNSIFKKNNF
ncbi:MAG: preprotein translocase subunit SecY [Enterobacteriaceae bacterium PSpyr]|nr:MAG: preprotein translocase subunit SecY [Enterobacteriaceae bacterium PSpyr]